MIHTLKMTSHWIIRLLTIGLLLFYLIMTISGYFADQQQLIYPEKPILIIGIIISIGLFALIWGASYWLSKQYVGWLVAALTLLTLPKIVLVFLFKIKPVSDMYSYNALGGSSASGDSWHWMYTHNGLDLNPLFPHVVHISSVFGWIDRLFINAPLTIQFFNILLTLVTAILIYYLGRQIGNHFIGVLASLIFYLIPPYYIYSILLGAEPLWLFLLVTAMLCFNRWRLGHWSLSNVYYWEWLMLTAIFLILAQLIRPIVTIWALAFFAFMLVVLHDNHVPATHLNTRTAHQLLNSLLILIVFAIFMNLSPKIDRQIYHIPFTTNTSIYSLTVGSNPKAKGMYDPILISKLEKINHQSKHNQRYQQMINLLKTQFHKNLDYLKETNGWLGFLITKNQIVSQSFYGIQLFIMNTKQPNSQIHLGKINPKLMRWATGITTGFQLILIVLSLLSLTCYWPNSKNWRIGNGALLLAIILDGVLLASSIVEVQSRYQIAWYLPMIILGALGMGKYDPKAPDKEDVKKIEEAFDETL